MVSSKTDAADDLESYLSLGLTVSQSKKKDAEYPKVLWLLSVYLDKVVQRNEELLGSNKIKESITIFHGQRVPYLSIKLYAERIFKYAQRSSSCFVLGLVYMERYLQQQNVYMTSLSVHLLLITSVVVAAKFIDDGLLNFSLVYKCFTGKCLDTITQPFTAYNTWFFNNAYYGKVGGISTREMNKLELDLLFSLDFRLKVNLETFRSYCLQLEKEALALVLQKPIHVQTTNRIKHFF